MKIEKMPEGYLLARKGGNGCELWRKFNGAESMACDAIDELIAERDELRAKIEEMEKQEPVRHEFQGRDGAWYPFINQRHYENTVADGTWPIRALYALPGAKGE